MQTSSKSDALYAQMRADILSLDLTPGSALRLPALSERYDVGVTPIRECLNRLSTDKLVVIEHNKGFRVADLALGDLLDIERGRSTIEGALFLRAIRNGGDAWEAAIIGAHHHLAATSPVSVLGTQDELDRWNRRHAAFHDALIAGADAPWMQHFRQQLTDQLGRYQKYIQTGLRDLYESHPDAAPKAAETYATALAMKPHDELYQVALLRDETAAEAVFQSHVNLSLHAFENLMALIPANTAMARTLRIPMVEIQI
ncbi:GntR family transcriptional regulator [Tateyamaria omphalii]|uniref:GntR family transcriptional regulator n=1 Tax=Tateyamaria omphalii TaxID=299262 RepID=UPI001C998E56|nr:GntR family transcriptional regulator [Tateyamaria omphalii]MBY5932692.1 GntR family transcriptional regulator [Tateyamaria omphalii]